MHPGRTIFCCTCAVRFLLPVVCSVHEHRAGGNPCGGSVSQCFSIYGTDLSLQHDNIAEHKGKKNVRKALALRKPVDDEELPPEVQRAAAFYSTHACPHARTRTHT